MQSAFMNSRNPLKDVLYYYNKASIKGFDSSLVSNTLEQINATIRARGNKPRVYDDYTSNEFDISWRMQQLTSHIKTALGEDQYFNQFHLGKTSRLIGDIGHKDTELIQKYFDKLHMLLKEKENGKMVGKELDFEQTVYGSFLNFVPRHYIFEGF